MRQICLLLFSGLLVGSCSDDPVGPPAHLLPGEAELLTRTFRMGRYTTWLSDQLTAVSVAALRYAQDKGGQLAGTITVTEEGWIYSDTPGDRLWIHSVHSPSWEIEVLHFRSEIPPTDFYHGNAFVGDLRCSITIDGETVTLNTSSTQVIGIPAHAVARPTNVCWDTRFNRTLSGRFKTANGDVLSLNLLNSGSGHGGCFLYLESRVIGDVSTPDMEVTVIDDLVDHTGCNWEMDIGHSWWFTNQENRVTAHGNTYRWNDVLVKGAQTFQSGCLRSPTVENPDDWAAEGTLTKNGRSLGTVIFDGPVESGTSGPWAVLTVGGIRVPLRDPAVTYEPPRVVPNPFWIPSS